MVWQGPSSRKRRILFSHYIQISKNGSGTGAGRVTVVLILLDTPFNFFFFLMEKSEYYLCWLLNYFALKDLLLFSLQVSSGSLVKNLPINSENMGFDP